MARAPRLNAPMLALTLALAVGLAGCQAPAKIVKGKVGAPPTNGVAGGSAIVGGGTAAPPPVAMQADGLRGRVTAPAGIVAAGAGNMVAAGAGNLVTTGSGSMVAAGAGNIVAAGAGNLGAGRRLLAIAQQPLAGARITLVDAAGEAVRGRDGKPLTATTDATGGYTFPTGVPARGVRVVVDLGAKGQLQAIAPNRRTQAPVDVDLISTLSSGYIVSQYVKPQADPRATLDRLPPDVEAETRARAAAALAGGKVAAPSRLDAGTVDATVASLRKEDACFDEQMETVRKLLVIGAESAAATDGPALSATIVPVGLAYDAGKAELYFLDQGLIRKLTPAGRIVTVAGSGQRGGADGAGRAATFRFPTALAFGPGGRVYVADTGDYKIRVVNTADATNPVTTLAGSGVSGAADGIGQAASFFNPSGTVVDQDGNLYVADWLNHKIRKVRPDGTVTTFAGSGTAGDADGPGAQATFNGPRGLARDAAGNLYVTQNDSAAIRKVAPDGAVSTIALRSPELLYGPDAIALDGSGNVYVTHTFGVAKITADGTTTILAGGLTHGMADGTGASALFTAPTGIAVSAAGDVFVADTGNNALRKISPMGVVTTIAGSGRSDANGAAAAALFNNIAAIVGNAAGELYVADSGSNTVRKVGLDGTVSAIAGSGQAGFADGAGSAASFNSPTGLALDAAGDLLVADTYANTIRRVGLADPTHPVTTVYGPPAADEQGPGFYPGPAVFDPVRGFIVAQNNQIDVLGADGKLTLVAGGSGEGAADGKGAAATFSGIAGLARDGQGNVYVAEATNTVIRKVTPDGTVTTVAGRPWVEGASSVGTDGQGATATFSQPYGIAIDGAGNLYVADLGTGIRQITPDGKVTTMAVTLPANAVLSGAIAVVGGDLVYSTSTQLFRVPLPR